MDTPVVVVCGPTASGKTRLAIDIALRMNGEVINADSMQIYRGMDIGTAKPGAHEMRGVPHHLIGTVGIDEPYSAAIYQQQARACIAAIAARGKLPILCGGTGLFISAAVYPLDFRQSSADEALRARLMEMERQQGAQALHDLLREKDPAAAGRIHANNTRRVIRALEIALGGREQPAGDAQLFNGQPIFPLAWLGISRDRESLNRRIDQRVDIMVQDGLLDEVRALTARYGRDAAAFQALGYKELFPVLDGQQPLTQAVERIKIGTHQYAKRQMTWFRRERAIRWLDADSFGNPDALLNAALGYIRQTLHIP